MQVCSTVWFHITLQDGALVLAHTAKWFKPRLPPNLPDVNSLEHYKTFHSKSKNSEGLKKSLGVRMEPAAAGQSTRPH